MTFFCVTCFDVLKVIVGIYLSVSQGKIVAVCKPDWQTTAPPLIQTQLTEGVCAP